MTIHLSFRKDDDEKICGNRCCWKDSFFGVFILLITMTALLWWKKTKKKPVRLRLTYEKEKHPEVHLTYFESLEFLKSFGCVEFENLLDWKIVKCALLMMLCWSLFLVIGMSLIMEGKDVSRNTENSALCVDSVLKECLFFFFSCSSLFLLSDVKCVWQRLFFCFNFCSTLKSGSLQRARC